MTAPPGAVDIAIIGAGAAGLAAAIFAGEEAVRLGRRLHIVLLDGARKPGAKILVSGGGRCNVTHAEVTPDDYCGGSPKIIRNVISRFDEQQTIQWMSSLGIDLKLEDTGKYFPVTDSARTVLDALLGRVHNLGIETRFGWRVSNLTQDTTGDNSVWLLANAIDGTTLHARSVIVATGGRALPKSGSDGAGYGWLDKLGHTIIPTVPALAPLILSEHGIAGSPLSKHFADLSGLSITARLEFVVDGRVHGSFTGPILFTHFGLSGPAPMNVSRHVARYRHDNPGTSQGQLQLGLTEFTDTRAADDWLLKQIQDRPKQTIANALRELMPERMAAVVASGVQAERLTDLTRDDRKHLAQLLAGSPLAVKGDRGYSFAEATAGGVALDEVRWKTMESRKADALYLVGEVLDVDGRIGGFNFQWAWSTGHIAGKAAAARS